MTTHVPTTLALDIGLDRAFAWESGGSVRYLVADLAASGTLESKAEAPPLNLALAIDVSGSMSGDKILAARRTALALARALTARDRLTIVAFNHHARTLLDACHMDDMGHEVASLAIEGLTADGNTNLWDGWVLAGERVALAMSRDARATHRVRCLARGSPLQQHDARRGIAGGNRETHLTYAGLTGHPLQQREIAQRDTIDRPNDFPGAQSRFRSR